MEETKTYWWWIRTQFHGLNGWKESQTLFFEAENEIEANKKMLDSIEGLLDCQQVVGNLEGPYESREIADKFAKLHDSYKVTKIS